MSAGTAARRIARSLARGAELASTRFPVATLLVIAFSALANAEVADVRLVSPETLGWWIAAVYSGAAASVVGKLLMEARGAALVVAQAASLAAALVIGGAVRYALPLGIFAPALVAAISLAVPLAPYVARPGDRQFWTFTLWTGVGIVLAFLSVLLFTLGVSAILEMVRFLFDVGLGSRAYEHMYTTALTLVGPLIALGRIPSDFDETIASTGEDRMAGGVRLLFDWVAAPLALVSAVVLHLYAAKILTLGALPANEVGWIVTSFALLVLSLRIGAEPFLATGRFFARIFARVWAAMLVVPLGLLTIAVAERVGPEGWTLERYYLALGALAAALILVAQIIPATRARIRLVAGVPLVLLALSSLGPLGVGDTVGRSQADRLSALVTVSGETVTIRDGAGAQAQSRIGALADVDELARAVSLLPEARRLAVTSQITDDLSGEAFGASSRAQALVADALGARIERSADAADARMFYASAQPPLVVTGYDALLPARTASPGRTKDEPPEGFGAFLDGADLVLAVGDIEDRFQLRPIIEAVPAAAFGNEASETNRPVDVRLTSTSGRVARLVVQSLVLARGDEPTSLTATILLRRQDWPGAALFGGDPEAGLAEPDGAIGEGPR
ncbi:MULTISPECIES: DUF4153 domain-containing protein [unclassified Aureimonas]|uniref:DUF4153 domain-containing protein n=1 Tax=unclassified Aureimonas TaxID=2615206 RepID=UPI0012E3E937|nr:MULTISPECIES: DUF4153 domain-containing protein [unclassified Aureimonas]